MEQKNSAYVEHVAIRVKDINWHIGYFGEVLGMTIREIRGPNASPDQVWLSGGMQLIADPEFDAPEGRLGHLGIMVDDLERAISETRNWGSNEMPQGRNWLALPSGLSIELIQALPGSVAAALAVKSRD